MEGQAGLITGDMVAEFMQNNKNRIKRGFLFLLLIAALLLLTYGCWFLLNHGKIAIASDDEIERVVYTALSDSTQEYAKGKSITVKTGEYQVTINLGDGRSYTTNISVSNFLRKTTIHPDVDDLPIERIASPTLRYLLPIQGGSYKSYQEGVWHLEHYSEVNGNEGGSIGVLMPYISSACKTADDILLLGYEKRATPIAYSAAIYNISSKSHKKLSKLSIPSHQDSKLSISRCHGGAVYVLDTQTGHGTRISAKDGATPFEIDNPKLLALYEDEAIMSANGDRVAILYGDDFFDSTSIDHTDADIIPLDNSTTQLHILSHDFSVIKNIPLGQRNDINQISLSPDGRKVAVAGLLDLSVYDVDTGNIVYKSTINTPTTDSILWLDSDRFVFASSARLLQTTISTQNTFSITNRLSATIHSLSLVDKGYLYFTAYDGPISNRILVGYRIRLKSN